MHCLRFVLPITEVFTSGIFITSILQSLNTGRDIVNFREMLVNPPPDHNTFLSIVTIFIEGRSAFKYFAYFAQIKKFEPFAIQLLGVDFNNGSRIVSNYISREMICFLIDLFIARYWMTANFIT